MKITIAVIGKLKAGAERELLNRYLDRAQKAGRQIGLSFAVREFTEDRNAAAAQRKTREAGTIVAALPQDASLVALDENGRNLTSADFARLLQRLRDDGVRELVLAIGGADGHGRDVLERATSKIAFGAMTWPHQMVRVMLCEQLYRAITILSGHPYHRD
jgi:23S rRNA (pseudouridine1915-N3)-methyltransferase